MTTTLPSRDTLDRLRDICDRLARSRTPTGVLECVAEGAAAVCPRASVAAYRLETATDEIRPVAGDQPAALPDEELQATLRDGESRPLEDVTHPTLCVPIGSAGVVTVVTDQDTTTHEPALELLRLFAAVSLSTGSAARRR